MTEQQPFKVQPRRVMRLPMPPRDYRRINKLKADDTARYSWAIYRGVITYTEAAEMWRLDYAIWNLEGRMFRAGRPMQLADGVVVQVNVRPAVAQSSQAAST